MRGTLGKVVRKRFGKQLRRRLPQYQRDAQAFLKGRLSTVAYLERRGVASSCSSSIRSRTILR